MLEGRLCGEMEAGAGEALYRVRDLSSGVRPSLCVRTSISVLLSPSNELMAESVRQLFDHTAYPGISLAPSPY